MSKPISLATPTVVIQFVADMMELLGTNYNFSTGAEERAIQAGLDQIDIGGNSEAVLDAIKFSLCSDSQPIVVWIH